MPSIANQIILVIGGSSGIGAAVAKLAALESLTVAIASSNPTRIQNAIESIKSIVPGAKITGHTVNLSTDEAEDSLLALFEEVTNKLGCMSPSILP